MFVLNTWYVAAWSHEVTHALLARRICDEPVCLYRTSAGKAVAMIDRCPHRMAPLSLGHLDGDAVQCIYHGITFDENGTCVRIPGQEHLDNVPGVKTFPLVERANWLWIWMGDPARADETLIPDAHWNADPDWAPCGDLMHFKANYQLLVDNLLDLSHEAFTHAGTIGNAVVAETPIRVSGEGNIVRVERFMENCAPPPLFTRVCGFTTNIDRTQIIEFTPPSFVMIDARAVPAKAAASTNGHTNGKTPGLEWRVLNAITPETETTCHYFWGNPRHFAQDDAEISKIVHEQITKTFLEDKHVIEGQQAVMSTLDQRTVFTSFDAGATRARRIVERMLDAERAPA